jgi:hypothetical protein
MWSLIRFAVLHMIVIPWIVAAWSPAPPDAEGAVQFPDTHAGRCARAFFAAFNADSDDAVRAFEEQHRATSALAARPMEDRLKQSRQMRRDWGKLTPRKVLNAEERSITLVAAAAGRGESFKFEFEFEFEAAAPYGLIAIRIEGPVDAEAIGAASRPLDAATRAEAIAAIIAALNEQYVFPDVARRMGEALQRHAAAGRYDGLNNAETLAGQLTSDLQAECSDKHLRVTAAGAGPSRRLGHGGEQRARENYGFRKVELLPRNIGYLKFDMFDQSPEAKSTAAAALAFVENCEALIFDLRENGGGSPEMIGFISSYLFDRPMVLNTFQDREGKVVSETRTQSEIPGKRFAADVPVYVLTSSRTFSGAEEFAYNLKNLKRATIVGETTGGGAHPVRMRELPGGLSVSIPFNRAVNPISGTNWEGAGVDPDIKTPAGEALEAARRDAEGRLAQRGQAGQ